jgi:hypothetical protein
VYILYLKPFFDVRRVIYTLRDFLNTRDSLILKLIPEVKNKELKENIVGLINSRKEKFNLTYNDAIESDIRLNSELKKLYEEINKIKNNRMVTGIFENIIKIEKELKNIRAKYNEVATKYNDNLVKRKNVCIKLLKMRPLNTYKVK